MIDRELPAADDGAAREPERNRSALVRDALREHIRRLEDRDREGYSRERQVPDEPRAWEAEAVWPTE